MDDDNDTVTISLRLAFGTTRSLEGYDNEIVKPVILVAALYHGYDYTFVGRGCVIQIALRSIAYRLDFKRRLHCFLCSVAMLLGL